VYLFDHIGRLREGGKWLQGKNRKVGKKKLYTYSHNIKQRKFDEGFPDISDQFEWFAIDYRATVRWPMSKTGTYEFRLNSDDGSILQVDGRDVIDNDGVHAMKSATGKFRFNGGRTYNMRLAYFQGPRFSIGLQLEYRKQGSKTWRVFDLQRL
jgi:hypothetical protein